jgi:hypothetical protein
MSHEIWVKRTIYVAQCECGKRYEYVSSPPRERMCECGRWVELKEESYIGPEIG